MPVKDKFNWIDLEPQIRELHSQGVDPANIAKQVQVGATTVREHMVSWGLLEPKPKLRQSLSGVIESSEEYTPHELASLFPLMLGEAFQDLKEDIRVHGQQEPVWLYNGQILDGRNRYFACQELGRPCLVRTYTGSTPLPFIVSLNLQRRHLTDSQRAMIAANLANKRQGERTDLEPSANLQKVSQSEAAELLNVSPRSVADAKTVLTDADPEVKQAVEKGELAVSAAVELSKEEPAVQKEVLNEVKTGQSRSVRESLKGRQSGNTPPKVKPKVEPPTLEETAAQWAKRLREETNGLSAMIQEFIEAGGTLTLVPAMTPFDLDWALQNLVYLMDKRLVGLRSILEKASEPRSEGA